jgi:hypothetical protein
MESAQKEFTMKKMTTFAALFLGWVCLTASKAAGSVVPGNCTVSDISLNSTVAAQFSLSDCGGDFLFSDYYRFFAPAKTRVTVTAASKTVGDIGLALLSSETGASLAVDLGPSTQVQYTVPNDDFFLIRVRTTELVTGSYSLHLTGTTVVNGCADDDPATLCVNSGRFRIHVAWQALHLGTQGVGTALSITDDTGYFWFFNSSNVELVIKVLDARTVNGHFWVFYGALTNVQYTVTVTDTLTGIVRTYSSPQDTQASVSDTAAF